MYLGTVKPNQVPTRCTEVVKMAHVMEEYEGTFCDIALDDIHEVAV